jgi:hypothetical protein
VAADELEGPVGQSFLDEGVGVEVLEGHVHGLLQDSENISSSANQM